MTREPVAGPRAAVPLAKGSGSGSAYAAGSDHAMMGGSMC